MRQAENTQNVFEMKERCVISDITHKGWEQHLSGLNDKKSNLSYNLVALKNNYLALVDNVG